MHVARLLSDDHAFKELDGFGEAFHRGHQAVFVFDAHDVVMLIGHNPDSEELASRLCGESVILRTADLVRIDFETEDWTQATAGRGTLTLVLRARELETR